MQNRIDSIKEALSNILIGIIIAWLITYLSNVYIDNKHTAATVSVLGCTIWSFIRQYFIRRWFNRKAPENIAAP